MEEGFSVVSISLQAVNVHTLMRLVRDQFIIPLLPSHRVNYALRGEEKGVLVIGLNVPMEGL